MTRENERLRRVFHEMHDADLPAPAYESPDAASGAPAASASTARPVRKSAVGRPGRTPVFARAAWAFAAAAAACAVVLALRDGGLLHPAPGAPTTPGEDETVQLAATLTTWEAPTDFLLTTPGAEFLQSAPRLGTGMETLSGDHGDLLQNDNNENDTEVYQ
ncbi:MAG TPA: hypothetical protein VFC25_15445 [Verrucomicrobiae bacterium]|nr:hypothetical protein [Verrucomicrobiae bacterium]